MPYWRLFYHIVWATKDRQSLITTDIEDFVYRVLAAKCTEKGGQVFIINGMPDHIHLVVAVPPSIALSDFVKHIKGASSHVIRKKFDIAFSWQRGYGIFSASPKTLDTAIEYVKNQKDHHRDDMVLASLERTSENDRGVKLVHRSPGDKSPG